MKNLFYAAISGIICLSKQTNNSLQPT